MAIKQVFVSDFDNTKEFATLREQLAFDAAKRHEVKINAFLDRNYPDGGPKSGPARSIAGKAVAKWLAEQDAQAVEAAE